MYTVQMRVSHFAVQVGPDGRVQVGASGYHVRDGGSRIHYKLEEERSTLARAIDQSVRAVPPPPAPAPANQTVL